MTLEMKNMSRLPGDEAFRRESLKGTQWEPTYAGALSFMRRRYTRDLKGVDIAVTGIAGPGGGSEEKPVGTVHLAVAGPGDAPVEHRVARFPGNRERIRIFAAQMALEMLRRRLIVHRPAAALQVAQ